ncbi:hypothetical protein [Pseudomonas syringae group sp. J309-1]|uniref:hypothetical protein n=1 Tax=Pseudomonas syringae group sp. J309-1 TaxID=3079588 RepID=UPI0029109957|nr:hypothetical protein [Pseudomonas syringae group sp. J309-1]MDU8361164.1 hypothetical protein [Pseudomonas syringae group sp. J309-1]
MNARMTSKPDRSAQDLINARTLIGRKVSGILHDQYYFNGEKCLIGKGSIEWQLGEHGYLSMYLLSNGESVGADLLPLEPPISFDLESGDTCSWLREDLLQDLEASHLVNIAVEDVIGMVDTWPNQKGHLVGFKILFETGDFIIFLNQGDEEAVLLNELPPESDGITTTWVSRIE